MSYRYRGSFESEPKSFFSGALSWLILLGFGGLVFLAIMAVVGGSRKAPVVVMDVGGIGPAINAQISGIFNPSTGTTLTFPAIWQRDKNQFGSEADWKEWSASACSVAAVTSVLNGFGKTVKMSDVLSLMRDQNAISATSGLYNYSVFSTIAAKYGLRAVYSESKDLDSHFNSIMTALQKGNPVIVNVQDPTFFPNGHFIVAVRANSADDTVSVINPDPAPGKQVTQNWPRETLKTYFSRSLRSAIYMPVA